MIDATIAVLVIVTVINILGWVYIRVYSYGSLNEKVKNMDDNIKRLDDTINNGLTERIDKVSVHLAKLEGKVSTYIELSKDKS